MLAFLTADHPVRDKTQWWLLYESAARAEEVLALDVADPRWAMVNLVRECRAGTLELFAPARKPGPPPGVTPAKDRARKRVIELHGFATQTLPSAGMS